MDEVLTSIGFIGLGVMGFPMAGHIKEKGHSVIIYNRSTEKADQWVRRFGGEKKDSPAETIKQCQLVLSCVGNDDDLRSIAYGSSGILSQIKKNQIWIDHTTTSASVALEIANEIEKKGAFFLDAPISGGQIGAEKGILTIMAGGDQNAFDQALPILESYGQAVTLMGPVGAGQKTKMVNQVCITGVLQGLAEGIHLAKNMNLDVPEVLNVISKGAAQSWQMQNRGLTMDKDEYDFGFSVEWMIKDLGICLDEADKNGTNLPVTNLVMDFYQKLRDMGGSRWDTSSLLRLLEKDNH